MVELRIARIREAEIAGRIRPALPERGAGTAGPILAIQAKNELPFRVVCEPFDGPEYPASLIRERRASGAVAGGPAIREQDGDGAGRIDAVFRERIERPFRRQVALARLDQAVIAAGPAGEPCQNPLPPGGRQLMRRVRLPERPVVALRAVPVAGEDDRGGPLRPLLPDDDAPLGAARDPKSAAGLHAVAARHDEVLRLPVRYVGDEPLHDVEIAQLPVLPLQRDPLAGVDDRAGRRLPRHVGQGEPFRLALHGLVRLRRLHLAKIDEAESLREGRGGDRRHLRRHQPLVPPVEHGRGTARALEPQSGKPEKIDRMSAGKQHRGDGKAKLDLVRPGGQHGDRAAGPGGGSRRPAGRFQPFRRVPREIPSADRIPGGPHRPAGVVLDQLAQAGAVELCGLEQGADLLVYFVPMRAVHAQGLLEVIERPAAVSPAFLNRCHFAMAAGESERGRRERAPEPGHRPRLVRRLAKHRERFPIGRRGGVEPALRTLLVPGDAERARAVEQQRVRPGQPLALQRARRSRSGRHADARVVRADLPARPPHRLAAQVRGFRAVASLLEQGRQPLPRIELVGIDGDRELEVVDRFLDLAVLGLHLRELDMRRGPGRVEAERIAVGVDRSGPVVALPPEARHLAVNRCARRRGCEDALEIGGGADVMPRIPADRRGEQQQPRILRRMLQQILTGGQGIPEPAPPPHSLDRGQPVGPRLESGSHRCRHPRIRFRLTEGI